MAIATYVHVDVATQGHAYFGYFASARAHARHILRVCVFLVIRFICVPSSSSSSEGSILFLKDNGCSRGGGREGGGREGGRERREGGIEWV